jgi:phage FluMu protein Com
MRNWIVIVYLIGVLKRKENILMQIRCFHCHKPFAMGKEAVHQALQEMTAGGLGHHNAYCPHCGRANRVSLQELRRAAPEWIPEQQPTDQGEGTPEP